MIPQGYPLWAIEINQAPWTSAAEEFGMDAAEIKAEYAAEHDLTDADLDRLDAVNVVRVIGWRVKGDGEPFPIVIGSLIEPGGKGWYLRYADTEQEARRLGLRILRGICEIARKAPRAAQ